LGKQNRISSDGMKWLSMSMRLLGILTYSLGILFWYPEKYGIWQPFVFGGTTYCDFYCISLQHLWHADSKNDQIWTI